jgi:starch-binding outer membrane protein, SusD/RagB family
MASMRPRHLTSLSLLAAVTACSPDKVLDVKLETSVPAEVAINDPVGARAAVAGLYDALQDGSYYGETFYTWGDLSADNAQHSGTFSQYGDADRNALKADNSTVSGIWTAIYRSIARANVVIEALPNAAYLDANTRDQYLAEAYFVRALGHHNAVKLWADVPLITKVAAGPAEATSVTRSPVTEVYAAVLADLASAEQRSRDSKSTTKVSLGAIRALRTRVLLYQKSWAAAEAEANRVIAMGYRLATNYADLFDRAGAATPEDIFRVAFNAQDAGSVSRYYMSKSYGGRRELAPTNGFRAAYEAGDRRNAVTIQVDPSARAYVSKYPSVSGTEHIHVIRLAEILLVKAEAQARQGKLADALTTLTPIRVRAGLPALVLGSAGLTTQDQVVTAILRERRMELAFEGDRWPDLVRNGLAVSTLNIAAFQQLYPIPQRDRDAATAPGGTTSSLTQNPGY